MYSTWKYISGQMVFSPGLGWLTARTGSIRLVCLTTCVLYILGKIFLRTIFPIWKVMQFISQNKGVVRSSCKCFNWDKNDENMDIDEHVEAISIHEVPVVNEEALFQDAVYWRISQMSRPPTIV